MKALVLGASAAALLGCAAGASAHEIEKKEKRVRTIIVHKDGEGAAARHRAHVEVQRADCRDAIVKSDVDVETAGKEGKKQRTRLVICNDEADPATARTKVLEALQRARAGIARHDSERLSAEHRARALAALDAEIARLRAE